MRTPRDTFFYARMLKRCAAILGLSGLALAGCVSQGKYEELAKQHDALAEEKAALEQNIATERNKLSNTNDELEAIKAKAAEQEALLGEERARLSSTSEELQSMKAKAAEKEAMFARLKKELSSELDSKKLTLRQLKNGISVDLPEDILFASGSATLRPGGRTVLAKVSEQLRDADYQIWVSGFTDNIPISGKLVERFPTNWDLAAARATNVVRLLEENKVPSTKLIAVSYGENKPVAGNDTVEGRKKNRRIEIRLRPVVSED